MARRALRKIDPALDLSRHLRTVEQLPQPWSGESLFECSAPLEIEMGSGKGLFLAEAASKRPEHNFLGIEVATKYARYAAAKLARRNLANACMVHGDGLQVFREFLPDASAFAVHVYFPDPWWKARHKKRRVMNDAFLKDVQRVLVVGGKLHFWTDVEEYFQTSLEVIAQATQLRGPLPVPEATPEHDLDYRTHFERRKRQAGLAIYRAEFEKKP